MEEETKRDEEKVQELLQKLQIIRDGVIEERKKSKNYLSKIKEYESTLLKKDEEICKLSKEKNEIQQQLKIEKAKATKEIGFDGMIDRIFNKEKFSKEKLDKLLENNKNYVKANRDLQMKIEEEKEKYDQEKIKFQTKLSLKTKELQEVKEKLQQAQKYNASLEAFKKDINEKNKEFNQEQQKFNVLKLEQVKELEDSNKNFEQAMFLLGQAESDAKKLDEELNSLKEKLSEIAFKLYESKEEEKSSESKDSMSFKAQKGFKFGTKLTIKFRENHQYLDGNPEMVLDDEKGKIEVISLLEIKTLRVSEKNKEKVELVYTDDKGKEKKYELRFHEMVVDMFMDTYRKWTQKIRI